VANGASSAPVALVTFETASTDGTRKASSTDVTGRARKSSRADETSWAGRSTRAYGTHGATCAVQTVLAVDTSNSLWTSATSRARVTRYTGYALRALLTIAPVLARCSSDALRTDGTCLARATFVSLWASGSVPARVSWQSNTASGTILTVETWQTPRALQAVLAVGTSLTARTWRTFSATRALRTGVAFVALRAAGTGNAGSTLGASVTLVTLVTLGANFSRRTVTTVAAIPARQARVAVHTVAAVPAILTVDTILSRWSLWTRSAVFAVVTGLAGCASKANGPTTPSNAILAVSTVFAGETSATVDTRTAIPTRSAGWAWFAGQYGGDSIASILAGLAPRAGGAWKAVVARTSFGTSETTRTGLARGTSGATPTAKALCAHLAPRTWFPWSTTCSIFSRKADGARPSVFAVVAVDAGTARVALESISTGKSTRTWCRFKSTDSSNF